jgi:hypothetical protein
MSQNQKDNRLLHLEWETKFVALCLVTELNHNKK